MASRWRAAERAIDDAVAFLLCHFSGMSRYASNQDVVRFFAAHGIEVTHVRREGAVRHLCVQRQPLTLPLDASPDECLRRVRESVAAAEPSTPEL